MATDIELLDAWCGGDKAAGDALIRRYFEAVCRFFRSKLGEDVEDLIQRTFHICTVRRMDLGAGGSFRGFLFGVARNLLLDHLRRRYRRGPHDDVHVHSLRDLGTTPSEAVARGERERMIQEAMLRIPLEQRLLLELAHWEGLSGREIAQALEIGENTVRSRLSRARAALREALEQLGAAR
ncbi:MAG: sigma-70 family RNA polymerase sigma factor [Myxococcales bacterium]|nr:sigma-70 family RNA polymerase sigma factor [Myxococcales bacterium]